MKEFKVGDKVTIKCIEAVIRDNFSNYLRGDGKGQDQMVYDLLRELKKNGGVISGIYTLTNIYIISDIGLSKFNWSINKSHVFKFNDSLLDNNLFEI